MTGSEKYELLAKSKILLNVHRADTEYFEWVRVLEAMTNGCLVLSEPSLGYEPLAPGEHFFQPPSDVLIDYAVSLLSDPTLLNEIASDAYQFVKTKLAFTDLLQPILAEVEGIASTRPRTYRLADTDGGVATSTPPVGNHSDEDGHAALILSSVLETERRARTRIKDLLLGEIRTSRNIEALQALLRHGSARYLDVTTTGAFHSIDPTVSVVLSLYNYSSFVGEAIDSVVDSAGVVPELIVVDDHSRDGSADVVKQRMEDYDWFPILLVEKAANQGLSSARNTGFQYARAPYVFILDADNRIFPSTLRKLAHALDVSDAAFSYGVIAKFGTDEGLLSYLPWDIEKLTIANYIDAMAMIRKGVWEEFGGYDEATDAPFGWDGWEDYEFWLRIAAHELRGELVPEIVAEYRSHTTSMLSTVNLDTSALIAELKRRYPILPWPVP